VKTETCSSDSWVHPDKLTAYQFHLWKHKYGTGDLDYRAHYKSAKHGNRISIRRMEWLADAYAVARLKR
jgi:hypothetical protein